MRFDRPTTTPLITVFALFLLTVIAVPVAQAAVPQNGTLDFTVLRNGDPVGRHVMSFARTGDTLTVDIKTDVKVKLLFVTVYSFDHKGREVWQNGRLVALDSNTDDDGAEHTLAVRAEGGLLAVNGDGEKSTAAPEIVPASLWNEGILDGGVILNTLFGKKMDITVNDMGSESVTVAGRDVPARHYVIDGDLSRELWFDADKVLVKVRFKGSDDSDIEYVLR